MTTSRRQNILFSIGLSFLCMVFSPKLTAQETSGTEVKTSTFGGAITIQTKGISTIPNLTLGKPAAIVDMKMGRKLTFEPQFRFSLEGKPWAMVFWWRYNQAVSNKFRLNFSANTSLSFKTIKDTTSGAIPETIRSTRYVAAAITPSYQFNKYLGLGGYLFYTRGIEKFITRNTYMVALRPSVSNIPVAKNTVARIGPEVYFLKMDDQDGLFFNTSFLISVKNFPFSISGLINKKLQSTIPSEFDFLWNVGLIYTFNKEYVEKR